MDGDDCPVEEFLSDRTSYVANRDGLLELMERLANDGLSNLPKSLSHTVDEGDKIYEFSKGSLRLLYFQGTNGQIAVCTDGGIKKSQKVDPKLVRRAKRFKKEYVDAVRTGSLELVEESDNEN